MKLNVSLTRVQIGHLVSIMERAQGIMIEKEILQALRKTQNAHNERVRQAENFLAMVRDNDEK